MHLLLFSNSTMPGAPYLAWTRPWFDPFLENSGEILFVPYAAADASYDAYTRRVNEGLSVDRVIGIHTIADKAAALGRAHAILVGGGNTFCLLRRCQEEGLLGPIRDAVVAGAKYAGWSAGANLACPTIKTTNDMPVVATDGLDALGLVPYQINPHYTEQTIPGHGGESRSERLREFLVCNPESTVLGLPEGMLVEVEGQSTTLRGTGEARLFRAGTDPVVLSPGTLAR